MNPNRKRWLLRLAAVLILGLMGLWWAISHQTRELVVENHSGQTVASLKITLGRESKEFQNIRAEATRTAECNAKDGDRFTIEGRLADETRIRASGVLGDSVHFLVLPNGEIKFRPKGKNAR